jgi:hypothetical protein
MSAPAARELQIELGRVLGSRVELLERLRHPEQTSFALEKLHVQLEDGVELRLVRKDLSRRCLDENARWAKPPDLHDPMREVDVYASLLSDARLGCPSYYGAAVAAERDRYWMFLEDVAGTALWQRDDLESWCAVARWLAGLQRRAGPYRASLLRYDRTLLRRLIDPARLSAALRPRVARALVELAAAPLAFIHGDFYPSNILVSRETEPPRVCVLDWEAAGVGPRLWDLASLVAGWPEAEVVVIADAYRRALVRPLEWDAFVRELDVCRLCVAARWISWSQKWRPPHEHALDWNAAAAHLAERLIR